MSEDNGRQGELMFGFFNEIGIIAQLSGNAFEKVMTGGMTLSQFSVLNHLARLGGNRTPLQIARAMQVTKGTMTNTLGHLERARHISVRPDERDGRSKRVDRFSSSVCRSSRRRRKSRKVIRSMTSSGLEMPPDQKTFQIWSIWLLMLPVIMPWSFSVRCCGC